MIIHKGSNLINLEINRELSSENEDCSETDRAGAYNFLTKISGCFDHSHNIH